MNVLGTISKFRSLSLGTLLVLAPYIGTLTSSYKGVGEGLVTARKLGHRSNKPTSPLVCFSFAIPSWREAHHENRVDLWDMRQSLLTTAEEGIVAGTYAVYVQA